MSKPITDMLGNQLAEGQLVRLELQKAEIFGRIINFNPGGLAMPGKKELTLASFQIIGDVTIQCTPGDRIMSVIRLIDPREQEAAEKISSIVEAGQKALRFPRVVPNAPTPATESKDAGPPTNPTPTKQGPEK